jgi:hypothetical protein
MRRLLAVFALGALGSLAAAGSGRAEGDDAFAGIVRRADEARTRLLGDLPRSRRDRETALDARRLELVFLLENEAAELDSYAATAAPTSAAVARSRAANARLEALGCVASLDSQAQAHALVQELLASDAETRVRALVELRIFAQRDASWKDELVRDAFDRWIRADHAAILDAHRGRVLVLLLESGVASRAQGADDVERRALVDKMGARGLDLAQAKIESKLPFELVLDRGGHVRGVDPVGAERRALVEKLLAESGEQ